MIDYFEERRSQANATMQIHPGEVIFEGDALAQFALLDAYLDEQPDK